MRQQIGDRAGEAASWFQLGNLAGRLGKAAEGLRRVGLCYLIDREISHGNTDSDLNAVRQLAVQLGYTPDESYVQNHGAQLLKDAFGLH